MAHEMIDGTYRQTNLPNESAEYLSKREELRLAEIDLMYQREKVATLRRQLPPGAIVKDYEFVEARSALDQDSAISVFTRDRQGTVRHFYSVHPRLAHDIETRGTDEYNPIWNVLDLTPQGRGNFDASLDYGTSVQWAGK